MLILLDKKDKLVARALIWKLDDGRLYMDRIYTTNNYHKIKFDIYAEEKGIHLMHDDIMKDFQKVSVTLKNINYGGKENYPYMDTLKYCRIDESCLKNYQINSRREIILNWN